MALSKKKCPLFSDVFFSTSERRNMGVSIICPSATPGSRSSALCRDLDFCLHGHCWHRPGAPVGPQEMLQTKRAPRILSFPPPKKKPISPTWCLGGSGFWGKKKSEIRGYLWLLSSEVKWFDFHTCSVFRPLGEASWQEHQQAVEEEFGPENFVVVVRGLLDEVGRLLIFIRFRDGFCSLGSFGWMGQTSFEWGSWVWFFGQKGGLSSYNQTNWWR